MYKSRKCMIYLASQQHLSSHSSVNSRCNLMFCFGCFTWPNVTVLYTSTQPMVISVYMFKFIVQSEWGLYIFNAVQVNGGRIWSVQGSNKACQWNALKSNKRPLSGLEQGARWHHENKEIELVEGPSLENMSRSELTVGMRFKVVLGSLTDYL